MRRPDFIVVGAARAGTTALYSYLRQHPEVFLPDVKEPCFFIFENEHRKMKKGKFAFAVRTAAGYERLFEGARGDQKTGEMSTPYLYLHEKAIHTMKQHFPDYSEIRIVIILRNPADRAYSQYLWKVRDGREPLSFEEAIEAENTRRSENYSFDYFYVDRGFYSQQVKHYQEMFKRVHVILYEDFKRETDSVLAELCRFLEISPSVHFRPVKSLNSSSIPKSPLFSRIMTTESKLKFKIWYSLPDHSRKKIRTWFDSMNGKKGNLPAMKHSTRARLVEIYREDIIALSKLIDKDLTGWLK